MNREAHKWWGASPFMSCFLGWKRGMVIRSCAALTILWVVWMERIRRSFEDARRTIQTICGTEFTFGHSCGLRFPLSLGVGRFMLFVRIGMLLSRNFGSKLRMLGNTARNAWLCKFKHRNPMYSTFIIILK